jgi:hypothetical protein
MERMIYKEEQSFRQSYIPWIMLAAIVFLIGSFGIGFYQQLYLGRPYGDEPMSNNGLIWSSILTFLFLSAVFIFILNGVLVTEIWTDGIRFKFTPFIWKTKHIPLSEIASAEVGKYRPLAEFGGWGVRKRFLTRKTAYNVSGRIGLRVIKKNGSQVMFGTQKPEEIKRAVDKMLAHSTT